MRGAKLKQAAWRKSTRSGGGNNCVEVAPVEGFVAVRDSKDPDGPAFVFRPQEWTAFVSKLRG